MNIHIEHVPFARYGSFLTFSVLPPAWGHKGLILRTMHKKGMHECFRLALVKNDREQRYTVSATPILCTLTPTGNTKGKVEICLPETDVARIRATEGLTLRLVSIPPIKGQYAFPLKEGIWNANCGANGVQYRMIPLQGDLVVDSFRTLGTHSRGKKKKVEKTPDRPPIIADFLPNDKGEMECCLQEYIMSPPKLQTLEKTFRQCSLLAEKDWKAWKKSTPTMPKTYQAAAEHAMYTNYSATVGVWKNFKQPTMLMSRNWMTNCWSWDHCFNAIACSYKQPEVAWNQLMVHFELQEPSGCLPDGVSAESMGWNYCKPPIHGWTLSKLLGNRVLARDAKRLKQFYPKLVKWTNWWFEVRDNDGDGLPEYHHGNDSGWDNATVFDEGFPFCGADLQAFLVLQMDMLSKLAETLGKSRDAKRWKTKADRHLDHMIETLWDGDQFRGRKAFDYEVPDADGCLLNHMPIVLGKRLPKPIRDKVAAHLTPKGRFLTKYGLATEAPDSPMYIESGYWRGPIWGPEVVLITDGLWRGGYKQQAKEIAKRYCAMCKQSELFAENYDPLSGEPLCDKAYTWGSSAYLICAHEYLR
jgi:hypothetical protein